MKLPKIATDDALLFGFLAVLALGCAVTVASTSGNGLLAFGIALIVFGAPATLLIFMAAAEESK